jgi:hypothetical protein
MTTRGALITTPATGLSALASRDAKCSARRPVERLGLQHDRLAVRDHELRAAIDEYTYALAGSWWVRRVKPPSS